MLLCMYISLAYIGIPVVDIALDMVSLQYQMIIKFMLLQLLLNFLFHHHVVPIWDP